MRRIRRVGGMALAGFLLTAVVGGPAASAQTVTKTPETYIGTASGRALNLQIAGSGLTAGASSVSLDSTLKAVAQGTGFLSPLGSSQTAKLEQIGEGVKTAEETCATPTLPAAVSAIVSLQAGCSSALAQVEGGLPHATALGKVAGADVDLSALLAQSPVSIEDTLGTVLTPVLGTLDEVEVALEGVIGEDIALSDSLSQVSDALLTTKTLEVDLGTSTSETIVDGSKVTSIAKSEGGVIKLFPLGAQLETIAGVELAPIVEIVVGSAQATAVYDRATGASTPSFDPALLTIRVNTPVVDAAGKIVGQDLSEIVINPDLSPSVLPTATAAVVKPCTDAANEFCILEGSPLETRIAVASGRTVTNPDGSVGAVADAVKIHALKNIGSVVAPLDGGILLELAHAEAGVGGAPAEVLTLTTPDLPRELPRTGGTPVLPMIAVAGIGIALAARRTIAKAVASR